MNTKQVLRIWEKLISPGIPIAVVGVLGVICFINTAGHPGVVVWPIVGAISCLIFAGGVGTILILRRLAIKKTGHWI
ncbi:hypothetical protein [Frondihabitans sp. PAMC 28766]|uniref:hypothetical protein n=1 Tax=Frondihabitans sp. PAMC 28766 TaxID=1795630 RepID=UPI0012FF689A|nr:hypothetical protein [Frondihabitans sp. PAMC 28766]